MTLSELIDEINGNRPQGNLSSAIRLFVLDCFKSRVADTASDSRPYQAAHDYSLLL
jgi:predicted DNA-binding ribbon-helix-helix protein